MRWLGPIVLELHTGWPRAGWEFGLRVLEEMAAKGTIRFDPAPRTNAHDVHEVKRVHRVLRTADSCVFDEEMRRWVRR